MPDTAPTLGSDLRAAVRDQERHLQQDQLAHDLRRLVDDAERLLRLRADQIGDGAAEWRSSTQARLAELRDRFDGLQRQTADRVRSVSRQTNTFVHENPWASVGMAAGAALLAGYLINSRR